MATKLSGDSPLLIGSDAMRMQESGESQCFSHMWYFSKEEIENHSPSRRDGIDFSTESHLRKLYCSFLQDLGKTLKVPQLTIATSTIFCHQFYMRQSHAKNDWQTVAIVCLFTACKVEETPRLLRDVVVMGYEMMYKWDPSASRRIRQKEIYDKQKELILTGERLLLSTIAFDLNIQHPYKPLVKALKRLGISNCDVPKVAWNFVNDWLSTTLCLQYKPHYIAAGSLFLAAKFQRVKLPTEKGREWWLEFDLSFKHLEEVIQQMLKSLEQNKKQALSGMKMTESTTSAGKAALRNGPLVNSARCSCGKNVTLGNSSISGREPLECQRSDCGSAGSTIEDADGCDTRKRTGESATDMHCKIVNVGGSRRHIRDANQIGEA